MPVLSPAAIYRLATDAGLTPAQAVVATAIALAESGGRTDAVGDTGLTDATWGPSVGLWQVRSLKAQTGTGQARDVSRLTDPAFNARAMVEISGRGSNWRPWSVYTNGAYRTHLGRVTDETGHNRFEGGGGTVENAATLSPLEQAFGDWSGDLLGIGIKVGATIGALALVIVGLNRTVGT